MSFKENECFSITVNLNRIQKIDLYLFSSTKTFSNNKPHFCLKTANYKDQSVRKCPAGLTNLCGQIYNVKVSFFKTM